MSAVSFSPGMMSLLLVSLCAKGVSSNLTDASHPYPYAFGWVRVRSELCNGFRHGTFGLLDKIRLSLVYSLQFILRKKGIGNGMGILALGHCERDNKNKSLSNLSHGLRYDFLKHNNL
jgi:hypothetical protein